MRHAPVVTFMSAIFLVGCHAPDGSLDWRRMGNVAGTTVMAGGGLLLGGPAGAAVGFGIGSSLFDSTGRQVPATRTVNGRQSYSSVAQRSAKTQSPAAASSAATASTTKPQETDTPKPAPTLPTATSPGPKEAETIGI
jgi:hypothetical protein